MVLTLAKPKTRKAVSKSKIERPKSYSDESVDSESRDRKMAAKPT